MKNNYSHDEIIVSKGKVGQRKFLPPFWGNVVMPTFQVMGMGDQPTFRISDIKSRRFDLIDRDTQKKRQEIMTKEDEAIFKMMDDIVGKDGA